MGSPQLPLPTAPSPGMVPRIAQPFEASEEAIPTPIQPAQMPSGSTQQVLIQQIQVQGIQHVDMQDIQNITAPFIGRSSTLDELQAVVDEITKLYEQKGYITTVVFIPPQKIENGVLTIQVEEGVVSEVEYEEGKFFKDIAVEPRIDLGPGKVLNIKNLQRSIRRINEHPDLHVQAILRAGAEPGDTRVIIKPMEDRFFLHLMPFFDNLGRPTIGNKRGGFQVTNNNMLGLADTGYGNFYWTRKSWGNVSGYEIPFGKHGTKAGFSYAYNHFNFNRSDLNFKGSATLYTPYFTQELWRTERSTLTSELGFGFKNAGLQVEGFDVSKDRIRTLTPALNYISYDRWGRTVMRHEMGIG